MRKRNVLVTAIGTMNCTTIIKELKKHKDMFHIIGADINPGNLIANSKDVDEFYTFPKVTDNRELYYEYIKDFCIKNRVDLIFCVVDEEVALLSKNREELKQLGVTLCVANDSCVRLCHNKDLFSNWIEENIPKLYIKRFALPSDVSESDFPVFIKPIEGRASIGCTMVNSYNELTKYFHVWDEYVVQEYINSPIVAVDIVCNRASGQMEIAQRIELLRNANGCGIAVEIVDNTDIREACFELAEKLELNGVVNVEMFLTDDGPKIIEVNPRIPAGVEYSCLAGLNVVMNALYIATDNPCVFDPIKIGKFYTKRYETIEM